jgi:hypothetical protein
MRTFLNPQLPQLMSLPGLLLMFLLAVPPAAAAQGEFKMAGPYEVIARDGQY